MTEKDCNYKFACCLFIFNNIYSPDVFTESNPNPYILGGVFAVSNMDLKGEEHKILPTGQISLQAWT